MISTDKTIYTNPPGAYTKKLPDPQIAFVIDFFSGCGGMSWGFANTRQSHWAFKVLGGIDIDRNALATYERNIGAPGVWEDIKEMAENPERLRTLIPNFDPQTCRPLVFVGCPPCQGFSAHRKKDDRDDPRNSLMMSFARICNYFKPDIIVMENVPEILTGRFNKYYLAAEEELQKSNYILNKSVLDLSLYGVAQRRRRAVVIGSLTTVIPLPSPIFTRDKALTVRHAILHLNALAPGTTDPHDSSHKSPAHTERILERIKKTPSNGGDRRSIPIDEQLECHSALDNGSTPGFTDVYGRLRWDTPSVTITAKSSTPSCGRFLHPEQHRNISIREAAILQGFPQSFVFEGPLVQQYRQIGEAVPPLFARFIAWQILDHLSPHDKYASVVFSEQVQDKKVMPPSNIKVVDSFCGAGGIALGFKIAGYETAYAFDIDADSVSTFQQNISPVAQKVSIDSSNVSESINNVTRQSPFVMVGGPPCQGFSQQRRGVNEDHRNNLVLRYANLITSLERLPIAIILENVTYLDSPRGKKILEEYIGTLRDFGYEIFRHDLNSADYGVPQLRRRIIIVALNSQIARKYTGPMPITPNRWPTVGEAIAGLPEPYVSPLALWPNHIASREGDLNKRRIAYVDMGKGRMSIPPDLQLDCHTKYNGHLDVYGRLDYFSQGRTITGGFDSFTRGEYAHPFYHRSITPREAARIQGFPDWFVFSGNRASLRRQIGNAVPPPLAFALAIAIKKAICETGACS